MAVVQLTAIHTKPGANWEDIQAHIKKGSDLARKHGAENDTTMAAIAAGTATATLTMLSTNADWTSFGKFSDALYADPELQALLNNPHSPVATRDNYVFQTIPDL
jgi:hypothetical protein